MRPMQANSRELQNLHIKHGLVPRLPILNLGTGKLVECRKDCAGIQAQLPPHIVPPHPHPPQSDLGRSSAHVYIHCILDHSGELCSTLL